MGHISKCIYTWHTRTCTESARARVCYEGILQLCFYRRDLVYIKKDWSAVLSGNVRGWLSGVKEGSRDREYCVDPVPLPAAAAWENRVQDPSPRGPQADRRGAASRAGASVAGQAPGEGRERPGGELA